MQSEYRLAHLMRGIWVEHENLGLLVVVGETLHGPMIDDITRQPATVVPRLMSQPAAAAELISNAGMIRRIYESDTDS